MAPAAAFRAGSAPTCTVAPSAHAGMRRASGKRAARSGVTVSVIASRNG